MQLTVSPDDAVTATAVAVALDVVVSGLAPPPQPTMVRTSSVASRSSGFIKLSIKAYRNAFPDILLTVFVFVRTITLVHSHYAKLSIHGELGEPVLGVNPLQRAGQNLFDPNPSANPGGNRAGLVRQAADTVEIQPEANFMVPSQLRIFGRRNSRDSLLAGGKLERQTAELSRHMGLYLGTDPDHMAVRSAILRLL